jgi:hypothetical protein
MFQYYYNQNLRKLVVGFGTLFDKISVNHVNPDGGEDLNIRVPIVYASQEKFIRRLTEPSSITDGIRVETQLPRMSYIMTSIQQDATRRRNRNNPLKTSVGGNCDSSLIITEEIPVNIGFTLFIYTRHIDDTLQIVEQIMPYFAPEHIISLSLNEAQNYVKIPIIMTSNNISERYDGEFSTRRLNVSSFNFIAKSYIFGPLQTVTNISGITSSSNVNFNF